ncbi:glycoside hydrolase family 2 [Clostridium sp. SYSU_GA19001]|uniref:glycoside hydrolase family 2 protein n=1 Tax=Clostridium caldaquaticum TaxID=2940653 RepID=UPI0020773C9A|nr:sugar-binding domain-containing protein [Clostridium caldaquaticum]MCM8709687.1 glycoside hydrolase family 2 [Clostridium caldaquaticum]
MIHNLPRQEYPRPQFERNCWLNLNGEWNFDFDDNNIGIKNAWFVKPEFKQIIIVPYIYQSKLSGINNQDFHDIVWYSKTFDLTEELKGKRIILNFGAVDYKSDIWVNGTHMMSHEGGHVPFSIEITNIVKEKDNLIVVRVEDYTTDLELPRGKQYWKRTSEGIFYTRTTGIWQTVWVEGVAETYLNKVWMTPDVDRKKIFIEYELDGTCQNTQLGITISLGDKVLVDDKIKVINGRGKREFWLDQEITIDWNHQESWVWTPENPVLFDILFTVYNNDVKLDEVKSYFGLRKVSIVDGKFMLNNRPYYQKMLLDQGYWEDSLLTAPTDEDFVKDITLSKKMGFNGVRKHQKIEDPRYLYWADKLGFLVWGEIASAYVYSRKYVKRITNEWMTMIERDYNHPCIVAWTPLNESWGVDCIMNNKNEQAHSAAMYYITKSLDSTRPVISNDGWDHTKSDLFTIHDYEWRKETLKERYSSIENILKTKHSGRGMFAQGWSYEGQPIIISEFGGISYQKGNWQGWGYSSATSDEDFVKRYYDVVSAILESPLIQGFVYTQITDVEQEINGLLTYDRKPKIDVEIIKAINEGKWKP